LNISDILRNISKGRIGGESGHQASVIEAVLKEVVLISNLPL
jgi:hypothetical protein